MAYAARPLAERFWPKVKKGKGNRCWLWTASVDGNGYGKIYGGPDIGRLIKASHASWVIHYGPVPPGLCVLHTCDNPPCVRPDHLFLGTQGENMKDMRDKGRAKSFNPHYGLANGRHTKPESFFGERNSSAKLTNAQALEIRESTIATRYLAERFGVSKTVIRGIRARRGWKHLPEK